MYRQKILFGNLGLDTCTVHTFFLSNELQVRPTFCEYFIKLCFICLPSDFTVFAGTKPRTVAVLALTVRVASTWQHLIHTRLPRLIQFPNSINISPDSLHLFYVGVPSYALYF